MIEQLPIWLAVFFLVWRIHQLRQRIKAIETRDWPQRVVEWRTVRPINCRCQPITTQEQNQMPGPIIWIEGIIGAGKSTLTRALADELKLRAIMEPVKTNPYLELFYDDQKRWAFPLQIELMGRRYALQQLAAYEALSEGGYRGAILDRGLPGDRVFARMHMLAGNISELEFATYERWFDIMTSSLRVPSLVVFLDVTPEVALERIRGRGRKAEKDIPIEYLRDLRKGYLDLLIEIESGQHAWSAGMGVKRVAWNTDHQPTEALAEELRHRFRL